jgi:hypothetical protein
MARSTILANEKERSGRHSNDRDDDDCGFDDRALWHRKFDKDDDWHYSHDRHNSHSKHESGKNDRRSDRRDDDCRRDDDDHSLELDIDVDRDGKWLEIEIEIGKFDFELIVDARSLVADTTPVATMFGGEGTALGQDTLVDADIFGRLLDLGKVTVAYGTTTFKSAAVSDGEGGAFAFADTFADVAGADLVFIFTNKSSISGSYDGDNYAIETSITTFVAIDFEDFDFAEGQIIFDLYDALSYLEGSGHGGGKDGKQVPRLDGNVAILDADVLAEAENTVVDILASVLTFEDQLSTVSAMAVTAGG